MSRALAVLRPEPGNAATAARIEARGLTAIRCPLFEVRPLAWTIPDPADHDALLLTSANTVRHGGPGLSALRSLPVLAVGTATANAARAAGFGVSLIGNEDAAQLVSLAASAGVGRALHLGGRDRTMPRCAIVSAAIAVYASDAVAVSRAELARLDGTVALLHSARAALRLGALVPDRTGWRIAALSRAVAAAAGPGWAATAVADAPDDAALITAAIMLAD